MRIAFIADPEFATRERPLLARLAVGLLDEIAPPVIIEPASAEPRPHSGPIQHVVWEDRGFTLTLNLRIERITSALQRRKLTPDIVHALGTDAWQPAIRLARRTHAALLLEVESQSALARVHTADRAIAAIANPLTTDPAATNQDSPIPAAAFIASDPALEPPLQQHAKHLPVHLAPWGVHRAPRPGSAERPATTTDRPTAVCLIPAPGSPPPLPTLTALADIAHLTPLHLFIDEAAAAGSRGRLWNTLENLGLSSSADIVPNLEENRELTLRCDILALPGPAARARSIVLDAMAARLAVVADPDHLVEPLARSDLYRPAAPRDIDAWRQALQNAIEADPAADPRREAAARYADEQRRPSAHITALLSTYNALTAPKALAFKQAAG